MAITASDARQKLFPLIQQVNDDQEAIEIVSRRGTAYLVSQAQYRSLVETAYLLRSPANAARLAASIAALEAGAGQVHPLTDNAEEVAQQDVVPTARKVSARARKPGTSKPGRA